MSVGSAVSERVVVMEDGGFRDLINLLFVGYFPSDERIEREALSELGIIKDESMDDLDIEVQQLVRWGEADTFRRSLWYTIGNLGMNCSSNVIVVESDDLPTDEEISEFREGFGEAINDLRGLLIFYRDNFEESSIEGTRFAQKDIFFFKRVELK